MVVGNLSVIEKFRQYLPYSHKVLIYDDKVGVIYHIRMSSSPFGKQQDIYNMLEV